MGISIHSSVLNVQYFPFREQTLVAIYAFPMEVSGEAGHAALDVLTMQTVVALSEYFLDLSPRVRERWNCPAY